MGLFEVQGVIWAPYNDDFLVAVSHFLRCGIGSFLFKFLDVPMGENPRRLETWKPVFGKTRKHLSLWKAGRVNIYHCIYSLSLKLQREEERLNQIQRIFLWGV